MTTQPVLLPAPPSPSRLAPPWRRTDPVARPRLLQRLSSAAEAPVFVLRAPAGYGKSTLLAQFAALERRPVAWLALDERDDDPVVLLHDLAHALHRVAPMPDDVLAALAPSPATVLTVGVPRLLTWLGDQGGPLVIVLDDVHHLMRPETCDVVRALCDGAPRGTTIVLAGRAKPPIALARLRAEGRLAELSAADLRMTPAEGTAMLGAAGAEIEDAEGAFVVERTEGWAAAIYLAALMLRGDRAAEGTSAPGPSEADLAEYFREEVLAGVDPDDADFLVRSSILDELDPDVCDEVLEREDSAARLRQLTDADVFVSPADAAGGRYRVHGLFREILQAQLRRRTRGGEAPALHARAAAAYATRGEADRAVRHAVAAGDPARAAAIVWDAAPAAISHGRSATVLRWRSWFSDDAVLAHPVIAVAEGWAALEQGDAERAAHAAAILLAASDERVTNDGATLRDHGRLLRATLGEHGMQQAVTDARIAADGFDPQAPTRSIPLLLLGLHATAQRAPDAAELLAEAEALSAGTLPTVYGMILAQQAILAFEGGDWPAATTLIGRAHAFQRSNGIEDYAMQGTVTAVHALVEAQAGREAPARRFAEQAVRNLALQGSMYRWLAIQTRLVLARTWVRLGDPGRARILLGEARDMLEPEPLPLLRAWADDLAGRVAAGPPGSAGPGLTTAELRTLQYLPTHLSLREIGERLFVTRNTVKTHTISIYRKLEVTSRSQAVVRARELGILEAGGAVIRNG